MVNRCGLAINGHQRGKDDQGEKSGVGHCGGTRCDEKRTEREKKHVWICNIHTVRQPHNWCGHTVYPSVPTVTALMGLNDPDEASEKSKSIEIWLGHLTVS
jgi:hypothetical protein